MDKLGVLEVISSSDVDIVTLAEVILSCVFVSAEVVKGDSEFMLIEKEMQCVVSRSDVVVMVVLISGDAIVEIIVL